MTGGVTDVCVHYTFVDAHQGDYHCYVIEDCTAGSSEDAHTSALKAMEYLQNGTVVKRSEMIEKINPEYWGERWDSWYDDWKYR